MFTNTFDKIVIFLCSKREYLNKKNMQLEVKLKKIDKSCYIQTANNLSFSFISTQLFHKLFSKPNDNDAMMKRQPKGM